FEAWRDRPWSRDMSYTTFRDYVLPYRGSEEPVRSFRPTMRERYANLAQEMKDPADAREAAALIRADVDRIIGFSDLYYLHPTDQAFDEMLTCKLGRCEDITNMVLYAWRANAIAAASDYTPAWADRDNNHAWEVVLDAKGSGHAGLGSRAAKIFRKTFAPQPSALGTRLRADEPAPRWLIGKHYADVTDQYQPVSDVTVTLSHAPQSGERFVYICVFNGGDWTAIHFAELQDSESVTFTGMGRNIAYLPAWYRDEELVPAGSPFILDPEGQVTVLSGGEGPSVSVEIMTIQPEVADADTQSIKPRITVKPNTDYELLTWDPEKAGWDSHSRHTADHDPVSISNIPGNRLYWLRSEEGRNLERIFTVEQGRQVWY
ncbi:MAG TPA: transglutaminase domain-containing protein, partial [Pirellulaceae bacterium]